MFHDKFITGVLIGVLADAVKLIFNYIAFSMGFTNVVFWQITAARFLGKADLFKPSAYLIGGIADLTVTAALGVVFLFTIYYLIGTDYLWVKSIGFGMAVWVGLFGTLLGESVQGKLPQSPSGIMVTIGAHLFFGLGLGFFTMLFYREVEGADGGKKGAFYRHFTPLPTAKIIESDSADDHDSDTKAEVKNTTKLSSLRRIIKIKKN
ncbi:hypothetical protein MFMK1_003525 [Metallumcola ferriviriculae]|uniref:Uncharacterized protein n=1 Tax=Metallumcola ferriviriculae TaxID=3039180 RepID=A0AAU0UUR4_9FIRM|nr:hypothetical protein MFMK1_003525 [Desulfitibacteraceae bacterium MK1]